MSIQSEIERIENNVKSTYAALEALGCDIPEVKTSDNLAPTAGTAKVVLYKEQTLTNKQKAQARENIGAVSQAELETKIADQLDGAKADIVQELINQLQGLPVFGTVNDDNTITVTSLLKSGEYTLMYENEDGTVSEVGKITVEEQMISYTNLADPTSSDWLTNYRYNSSGNLTTVSGGTIDLIMTNYLDVSSITDLHTKGIDFITDYSPGNSYDRVYFYDGDKNYLSSVYIKMDNGQSIYNYMETADYDNAVNIIHIAEVIKSSIAALNGNYLKDLDIVYIRLGGLCGTPSQVIITADDNIS